MLVEAHVGDLGIGVGTPRNRQGACLVAFEEQRVADDNARHRVGGMGELVREANVARGEDILGGRAQSLVHLDALFDWILHHYLQMLKVYYDKALLYLVLYDHQELSTILDL